MLKMCFVSRFVDCTLPSSDGMLLQRLWSFLESSWYVALCFICFFVHLSMLSCFSQFRSRLSRTSSIKKHWTWILWHLASSRPSLCGALCQKHGQRKKNRLHACFSLVVFCAELQTHWTLGRGYSTRNKVELELRVFYFIIALQISHHAKEEFAVCLTHWCPLAVIITHV